MPNVPSSRTSWHQGFPNRCCRHPLQRPHSFHAVNYTGHTEHLSLQRAPTDPTHGGRPWVVNYLNTSSLRDQDSTYMKVLQNGVFSDWLMITETRDCGMGSSLQASCSIVKADFTPLASNSSITTRLNSSGCSVACLLVARPFKP